MKLFHFILIFLGLSFSNALFAQQSGNHKGSCGVTGKTPWFESYRHNKSAIASEIQSRGGSDTTILFVPVTVHIVGRDNGSGFYRIEEALRCICTLNDQFKSSYIRFYLVSDEPFVFHKNTSWYVHDWDGGSEMIQASNLPNRLNAYIVDDPAGNCGYSWQDAIVLANGCSGVNNTTWAHEAGHHFSLPHPFVGWEGFDNYDYSLAAPEDIFGHPVEKFDESNCAEAGDYFCDTRADYLNFRWSCDVNKESNQLLHDPLDVPFRADASIIMGYASDECASRFSDEQIVAKRANLYTEHLSYLQVFEEQALIDDAAQVQLVSPIDTQMSQYNNITFHWNPVQNADIYVIEVSLAPSFPFSLTNKAVYNGITSITITQGLPNNRLLYWRVKAYSNWDVCQDNTVIQVGVTKTFNLSATNDLEKVAVVNLAPNPVQGGQTAQMTIESSESFDALLKVTDATGKSIFTQKVNIAFGDNALAVETNTLSAGIYQVSLQTSKGTVVKRLAVME